MVQIRGNLHYLQNTCIFLALFTEQLYFPYEYWEAHYWETQADITSTLCMHQNPKKLVNVIMVAVKHLS